MKRKFRIWIIKLIWNQFLIRSTPVIIESRRGNDWYLIDVFGQMWKLTYTGDASNPLTISLEQQL